LTTKSDKATVIAKAGSQGRTYMSVKQIHTNILEICI